MMAVIRGSKSLSAFVWSVIGLYRESWDSGASMLLFDRPVRPKGGIYQLNSGTFILGFDWLLETGTNGQLHTESLTHSNTSTMLCIHLYTSYSLFCRTAAFHRLSHWRTQLLLISWVTGRSRWASALGGTAVDFVEKKKKKRRRAWACNSPHICASSLTNSPHPALHHRPQRPVLDCSVLKGLCCIELM